MSNIPVLKHLLAAAPILLAVTLLPTERAAAQAVDDDPVAKITQLNRDAIGAYQSRKFEDARKLLKQALDLASASGLDAHPIKARTHIHMGVVIIGGFKQRDVGVKQFRKGLEIQPEIKLTKALVTPELESAFDQAAAEIKGGAAAETPEGGTGAPAAAAAATAPAAAAADSGGLVHDAVTDGKQGSAISISVSVQSDVAVAKMVLAYRAGTSGDFLGREMKQVSDGTYAAEIPTTATGGRAVAYYIEAEDKDGGLVASRGSADSPLVINLGGGSRAAAVARAGDDDEGEDEEEDEEDGGRVKIHVALLIGSGAGWATGTGDTNADATIKPAGVAWSQLGQFAPEVGYWWKPNLMFSLQGRFQAISGLGNSVMGPTDVVRPPSAPTKTFHASNYAVAIFAKATWAFGGKSKFRPFFSLAAGGGQIRHVVTFKTLKDCGPMRNQTCVDTIAAGPVVVGPGAGFFANLSETFGFVGQINTQLAFPKFTANADVNLGVALMF